MATLKNTVIPTSEGSKNYTRNPVFRSPLLAQELSETSLVPPVASRTSEPPHLSNRTTLARVRGGHFSPSAIVRIIVGFLLFTSCAKDKVDFAYDHSPVEHEEASVRIVNLAGYTHVVANGDTLTHSSRVTEYFPERGQLGALWSVPSNLFSDNGNLALELSGLGDLSVPFQVPNTGRQSVDYYTVWPGGNGQPYVVPVERDETPPTSPDHIKIRIVNLGKALPPLGYPAYSGSLENLYGSVTLAYADGTPVDARTTNVSLGQRASQYVELPYGAYQFKVLTQDGRQISTAAANRVDALPPIIDPATSRIANDYQRSGAARGSTTGLTYSELFTYQPGGVYTIVVSPFAFRYWSPAVLGNSPVYTVQNGFRIIEDNRPTYNNAYSRIQAVNAAAGLAVSFRIDGRTIGSAIPFASVSEYTSFRAGSTHIEAYGSSGNLLASLELEALPNQNYSVWLHPDEDGEHQLLVVANDLSGAVYKQLFSDDATYNLYWVNMPFAMRFVNLCPDIPYLSFTYNNGQDVRDNGTLTLVGTYVTHNDGAMYNLQPGSPTVDLPYVWWSYSTNISFHLMTYRSEPGVTPGVWANDIPVLNSGAFVHTPALYTQVGRAVPPYEAGVYTVALIGRVGEGVPDDQKARMITVKHHR